MPVDQIFTILASLCFMLSGWLGVHRPDHRLPWLWGNLVGAVMMLGAAWCYHNPWMAIGELYFIVLGVQGLWKNLTDIA